MKDSSLSLNDAIEKLNERKEVIAPNPGEMIEGVDGVRLLASGYELPIDEIGNWSEAVAISVLRTVQLMGAEPGVVVKGACIDGFILGVAFERMRQEQGSDI